MFRWIVYPLCLVAAGTSLRLEDVEEGSCRGTQFQPVHNKGVDFYKLVPTFRYIPAGSAYSQYLFASGQPNFPQMSKQHLRDNMCVKHTGADASGKGAQFGFGGRLMGTYTFSPRTGQTDVFNFDFSPSSTAGGVAFAPSSHVITLTDYKTFALLANCYTVNNVEQKTWEVISLTPKLSASTRRLIENHAVSLGFKRENFLFLNYDACSPTASQNNSSALNGPRKEFWRSRSGRQRGTFPRNSGWNK